jgi:hypothetical protein
MSARTRTEAAPRPVRSFSPVRGGFLQRRCACDGAAGLGTEPAAAPSVVHDALRAPGQALDASARASMERRFGHDFGRVRVHADAKAAESARAVNALAYTVGRDVVFGAGQYAPGTATGRRLLAHELTHVVQQDPAPAPGEGQPIVVEDHGASEAEARRASVAVETSDPPLGPSSGVTVGNRAAGAPRLQRQFVTPLGRGGGFGGLMERDRQNTFGGRTPLTAGQLPTPRDMALALARSLESQYPGWRDVLPDCPCRVEDARASSTWQEDNFLKRSLILPFFHPGSATAFRSARGYPTRPGTSHGQQCTYDELGGLITEGPAAGTPDVWSPVTHFSEHQEVDVEPFNLLGWQVYNQYWIPDGGSGCRANRGRRSESGPPGSGESRVVGTDSGPALQEEIPA